MILQNLVESVRDLFPKVGEPRIIKEIDLAQKEIARKTKMLITRAELVDIIDNLAWLMPDDFISLKELQVYDSNGYSLEIYNLGLKYEVINGVLYFISVTSTPLSEMPTSIASMFIEYYQLPASLTTISSSLTIPEDFYFALESFVMERMYSRYPVDSFDGQGNVIQRIDRQLVSYYNQKFKEYLIEAKKAQRQDNSDIDVQYYTTAGKQYLPKKNKYTAAGSIATISGISLIFSKYLSFIATSPSTIEVLTTYGYTDVTVEITGGNIVLTSTAEFDLTTEYKDNQSNNYSQISTSRIEVYPLTDWGTLQGRIFVTR